MAVHIRLRRGGKKKQPHYRIVVADSSSPRDGRFIERIGYYDPIPEIEEVSVDRERLIYWLKEGAIPTDTVRSLLKRKGIWKKVQDDLNPGQKGKPDSAKLEGQAKNDVPETEESTGDA